MTRAERKRRSEQRWAVIDEWIGRVVIVVAVGLVLVSMWLVAEQVLVNQILREVSK